MGEAVRVYRNLHRKCYSVQTKRPKAGWQLAFHANNLILTGVRFKVYEKGRERTLKTRSKCVHAYVLGALSSPHTLVFDTSSLTRVSYNPYKQPYFVKPDGSRIDSALAAYFTPGGVYVH